MAIPVWTTFIGIAVAEEAMVHVADRYIGRHVTTPGRRSLARFGLRQVQNAAGLIRFATTYKDKPLELLSATLASLMKPVERSIRRRTPVDVGRQKASVSTDVSVSPSKLGRGSYIAARSGWRGPTRRPSVVGFVIEYGSKRGRVEQRVVRSAVEKHKGKVVSSLPRLVADQVAAVVAAEMKDSIESKVLLTQHLIGFSVDAPVHARGVKSLGRSLFRVVRAG